MCVSIRYLILARICQVFTPGKRVYAKKDRRNSHKREPDSMNSKKVPLRSVESDNSPVVTRLRMAVRSNEGCRDWWFSRVRLSATS